MEHLLTSMSDCLRYPHNLIDPEQPLHIQAQFASRLEDERKRLFCDDSAASVAILDLADREERFMSKIVTNASEMNNLLRSDIHEQRKDPLCRFLFVQAKSSRDELSITREMLMLALTYHQVMPEFLDFIFPFGKQIYAPDFHYSGFRHESRIAEIDRGLQIEVRGRSGLTLQTCFNLKCIENPTDQVEWPWQPRQTAIYNSFDIENGRAMWVIIKAENIMRKRIMKATGAEDPNVSCSNCYNSAEQGLRSTLKMHLLICSWAGENWRDFIKFLENKLQVSTRDTLAACVDEKTGPLFEPQPIGKAPTFSTVARRDTMLSGRSLKRIFTMRKEPTRQFEVEEKPLLPKEPSISVEKLKSFSFNDLPRLQFVEDKANEGLLILMANVSILSKIRDYYVAFIASDDCPRPLAAACAGDVRRFERRITSIIEDLEMQVARLETFLRLLTGRKGLLLGILDYRNTVINTELSQNAAISGIRMAEMTQSMHASAKKTERETVSMRVITLVTLFYLPGTYISTLMSTDIIKFNPRDGRSIEDFSWPALRLYLAITLPLMFVTFLGWWLFYKWGDKEQDGRTWLRELFTGKAAGGLPV